MTAVRVARPGRAVAAVAGGVAAFAVIPVVLAPIQALAEQAGVPDPVLRAMLAVPDIVLAMVLVAGFATAWRHRQRLDRLDRAALAFVLVVVAYLAVDLVARAAGSELFTLAPDDLLLQGMAARAAVGSLLLLVAVRSVAVPAATVDRVLDVVLVSALVLAAGAVFEAIFPDTWEWFGTDILDFRSLQRDVFDMEAESDIVIYTIVGERQLVRAGSLLFDHLQLGFLLLPGLGVALTRAARQPSLRAWLALGLVGVGIVATMGRAAVASAVLVVGAVGVTRVSRVERRRVAVLAAVAAAGVLVIGASTGLIDRVVATVEASDDSTPIHIDSTRDALRQVGDRPLGIGLGTGAAVATRVPDDETLVAENAYLDVALQVGVVGAAIFVATVGFLIAALVRHRHDGDVAAVALGAVLALAMAGLLLHTWQMVETTWLVLGLAGLALPRTGTYVERS